MTNDRLAQIEKFKRHPTPEETRATLIRSFPELVPTSELLNMLTNFVQEQIQLAYFRGYQKGNDEGLDMAIEIMAERAGLI